MTHFDETSRRIRWSENEFSHSLSPEPTAVGAGRSAVAGVKPLGPRPFTGFTPRAGGGSAFVVRQHHTSQQIHIMKNIPSILKPIVAVTLVVLACSNLAFCGEIQVAAESGNLEKVKALIKDNPDLASSTNKNGWTALHFAAAAGHKDVAELLLANKADVNAKDKDGATPLHTAAANDHKDVAELLLANKAEVNAKDNEGMTPLHAAVITLHRDMVELLLASKADVNAKDNGGNTPLHYALMNANRAASAKDQTPLQVAIAKAYTDLAKWLRQHGSRE
jgi:ankyrin repeat protein